MVPNYLISHVEVAHGTGSVLFGVAKETGSKQSLRGIRQVLRAASKSSPMPEIKFNDLSSYKVEAQK